MVIIGKIIVQIIIEHYSMLQYINIIIAVYSSMVQKIQSMKQKYY